MEFKEAINRFSSWRTFKVKQITVKGYEFDLRSFCLYLRNPKIEDIELDQVLNYLREMENLGWDRCSFVRKCMAFRKFFEFYRRQGFNVLDEQLIPSPATQFKLPRIATEEGYQKLVASIPKESKDPRHVRNLAIVNLLWDSGARNGEICSLDVADVDIEQRRAVIHTEKAKSRRPFREIFWTAETNENLTKWIKRREHLKSVMADMDSSALFISISTIRVGHRLNMKGVGEMLRSYSNRAKIPYINAHSFRHHMGHDIIKQGGSSADVSNILGHSSLESSYIYSMMTGSELKNRWEKFKSP